MPEGPKLEARMAESGARVLGEGLTTPPHLTEGLRESCELPKLGRGKVPVDKNFFWHFGFFR